MNGQTYRYTVIFEREPDGGFVVHCLALPGCHSQGDTLDEALENIKEAIAVYLESLTDRNDCGFRKFWHRFSGNSGTTRILRDGGFQFQVFRSA